MKHILILFLIPLLISCDKQDREQELEKSQQSEEIDRLFEISQILSFQEYNHEKSNQLFFDTLKSKFSGLPIYDTLLEIRNESVKLSKSIHKFRVMLIEKTGGWSEKTYYTDRKNKLFIDTFFIKPNGPADSLQIILNEYSKFLFDRGLQIGELAPIGKGNVLYKYDKQFLGKGFAYTYFKDATMIEGLIILSYFKKEALGAEEKFYINTLLRKSSM